MPNHNEIRARLNNLDPELRNEIKELFDFFCPSLGEDPSCGVLIFSDENYDVINDSFSDVDELEQANFINLFISLELLVIEETR